jgi:hypothetical protein
MQQFRVIVAGLIWLDNFRTTFDVQTCTGLNFRATGDAPERRPEVSARS